MLFTQYLSGNTKIAYLCPKKHPASRGPHTPLTGALALDSAGGTDTDPEHIPPMPTMFSKPTVSELRRHEF